jgi:NAD(P)-dependent dehydrogenase (short-subunit alcohol dehydrogenase family)
MGTVELSGKVCLITGASRGIGAAVAERLGERGAVLALAARGPCDLGGARGSVHRVDLSDPGEALGLADEVLDRHGRVDVLVLNAGVRVDGAVADVSLQELDASFQVNVISPFVMAGRLAPLMALRGEGVVATVLAPKVSGGRRGMGAYAAPKAALESVTQTLRQEVGGKGVAVFGFDPGWVRTDLAPDGRESPGAAADRLVAHLETAKGSREILA